MYNPRMRDNSNVIAAIENIDKMKSWRDQNNSNCSYWNDKVMNLQKNFVWFMARLVDVLSADDLETYESIADNKKQEWVDSHDVDLEVYDSYHDAEMGHLSYLIQISPLHNEINDLQYEIVRAVILDGSIDKDRLEMLADSIGTLRGKADVLLKAAINAQMYIIDFERSFYS